MKFVKSNIFNLI